MEDQISTLTRKGITAASVGSSKESDSDIRAGKVTFVYGSPEVLVGSAEWRDAIQQKALQDRFVAVVVDEVHIVVQWSVHYLYLRFFYPKLCNSLLSYLQGVELASRLVMTKMSSRFECGAV